MFSGLTNQVSTWIGKKGEDGSELPADQQQQSPPADAAAAAVEGSDSAASGAAGLGSKLEMLSGVKSQVTSSMSGWLSGGIPGLNRGGGGAEEQMSTEQQQQQGVTTGEQAASGDGATDNVKDDDASSATGGADSGPGSLGGTPTDDKDGQQAFGAVSTKALAGAKSFGGFLYSAVNKAGKSVAEAGAKIKKTVEENRLIAELNKEQEAFIAGKPGEKGEAVAPWVGVPNEDALREECLALSTDRRNFVRAPPPGVDFAWDFEAVQPMAEATLALDPNLEAMRFELVPKVITEENFWRNYFYRVSLLRQSHEMNAMANESTESNPGQLASSDSVEQVSGSSTESKKTTRTTTVVAEITPASSKQRKTSDESMSRGENKEMEEEVKEGMKKLEIQSASKAGTGTGASEEDWERELEAELKDYEVVKGSQGGGGDNDEDDDDDLLSEDLK